MIPGNGLCTPDRLCDSEPVSSGAVSVELLQPAADLAAAKHRTMTTAMSVGLEGLNLTETPSCFSLLPGETLVRAIRAVDTESSGLAAGALVRLPDGFSHDLWLSDLDEAASSTRYRWETASGSKLQTRGAVLVLDALFHEHLQRGGSSIQLTVRLADARTAAVGARGASARAARARGFVQHEVTTAAAEEGGGRRFDSGVGSAAYTTLALKQAQLDSESVFILGQLAKERRRAFFSFNRSFTLDDGRDEGWSGVEATMVRDAWGGDGGDPSEDAAATLGADEADSHGRREGDVVRRLRTPPKMLGGFLSSESRSELAALAHALPFSHEEDSVDLQPSEHCMLFENGALLPVAEPWTDTLLALIGKLEAWARTRDALGDAVVTDAFVRRYASSSASVSSSSSRRSEIPAHWDSLAERTFVIELESASEGGVYLQLCAHIACRRYVDLTRAGDVLVHDWSAHHGVNVRSGERLALVLWLRNGLPHEAAPGAPFAPPPWLLGAAAAGDAVGQYSLASLLEGRGGAAQHFYEQAAAQGNPWAATRLGSRCELGLAPPPHKEVDAVGWWRRAAVQGSALAQRALAEMHLEGRLGATKDEALAQTLAVLAEQQGE